ncbi:MAG: carotenoid 1,2-hydratase [Pseudomonadota bacterium]
MRFDVRVAPNGYAWWYVDAISDDGVHGITLIAFIGSVFSPYYALSGRKDPENHCTLNVALYGPKARWAMTERGRGRVRRSASEFSIAKSALDWDGETLTVEINEFGAPLPTPLRGRVRLHAPWINEREFEIDPAGRHRWRPLCPASRVEVEMRDPGLSWSGWSYFDTNDGDAPLEADFREWHWSRAMLDEGGVAICYDTEPRESLPRGLALKFDRKGTLAEFDAPLQRVLPPATIWRAPRLLRSETETGAKVVRTLEDAPFYSRSEVETELFGARRRAVHESLAGDRLASPLVKALLPFRMPRLP